MRDGIDADHALGPGLQELVICIAGKDGVDHNAHRRLCPSLQEQLGPKSDVVEVWYGLVWVSQVRPWV